MSNWRIFSIRSRRERRRFFAALALALVLCAAASLCLGAVYLSPAELLWPLLGEDDSAG